MGEGDTGCMGGGNKVTRENRSEKERKADLEKGSGVWRGGVWQGNRLDT